MPALRAVERQKLPLIFCTSKTRAEVEYWRGVIGKRDPFIVENGGAVYIPRGYFAGPMTGTIERDGYDVIEFGTRYAELVETLRAAAAASVCRTRGFHEMDAVEIAARSRLPVRQAMLAKLREYDEPFTVLEGRVSRLLGMIGNSGKRCTRGGLFYHITGQNDKAAAVRRLSALYRERHPNLITMGLGDARNDAEFLNSVDIPVVVRSPFAGVLKRLVPRGRVTKRPGPQGWNEGVLEALAV